MEPKQCWLCGLHHDPEEQDCHYYAESMESRITELEQELALLYARSETPGFIKDLLAQNAELEQERDRLRGALEEIENWKDVDAISFQYNAIALARAALRDHEPVSKEAE